MKGVYGILIISIMTVLATRYLKQVYTFNYFSINELVFSDSDKVNIVGLLIILFPPYIGGIIIGIFGQAYAIDYVILYGLLTSLLIIWPVILYSIELLPNEAYKKKNTVYFLYFLYTIAITVVAYGGLNFYCTLIKGSVSNGLFIFKFLSFYDKLHPFYQKILDNVIWFAFLIPLSKAIIGIKKKLLGN